jgi:hypothetical protein
MPGTAHRLLLPVRKKVDRQGMKHSFLLNRPEVQPQKPPLILLKRYRKVKTSVVRQVRQVRRGQQVKKVKRGTRETPD